MRGNRDHHERRVRRVIRPRGDEKSGAGTVGSGYSHSSASGHALSVQLGTHLAAEAYSEAKEPVATGNLTWRRKSARTGMAE